MQCSCIHFRIHSRAQKNGELNDSLCDFKWKLEKRESIAGKGPVWFCSVFSKKLFTHLAIFTIWLFHIKSDIDVQKVFLQKFGIWVDYVKNINGMSNDIIFLEFSFQLAPPYRNIKKKCLKFQYSSLSGFKMESFIQS